MKIEQLVGRNEDNSFTGYACAHITGTRDELNYMEMRLVATGWNAPVVAMEETDNNKYIYTFDYDRDEAKDFKKFYMRFKKDYSEKRADTDWVAFDNKGFAGFYKIENKELIGCPMMKDGSMDEEESYAVEYLVSGEKEMKFLETINERLGSDFEYSEFIIA